MIRQSLISPHGPRSIVMLFIMMLLWTSCEEWVGMDGFRVGFVRAEVIGTSGPSCSVPMPRPTAPLPSCAGDPTATLEDAKSLAPKFAPEVRFHPLERYFFQDMGKWYNWSQLFLTDFRSPPGSAFDFILEDEATENLMSPRTYRSVLQSSNVASEEERAEILRGAPFDSSNRSTAPMYFTVNNYDVNDNYWVYNFNHFYSWNGCSNQALAISINGSSDVTNYIMCPVGVHEFDLERVSVLVCKEDREAKRIAYSQHAWTEERDCTLPPDDPQGCPRNPETGNFVTHAGLEGHGNYPAASPLDVYQFVSGTIKGAPVSLNNLGGVFIADRTLFGDKRWEPEPDGSNLIYIPPPAEIQEKNLTEFEFALYEGNWGAPLSMPSMTLWCLDNAQQTSLSQCSNDSIAVRGILMASKLLKITNIVESGENQVRTISETGEEDLGYAGQYNYSSSGLVNPVDTVLLGAPYGVKSPKNGSTAGYPSHPGVLTRGFSYIWVANRTAPIQSSYPNSILVCPENVQPTESIPEYVDFSSSVSTVTGYIVGVFVGDVVFSFLLLLLLSLPALIDKSAGVRHIATKKFVSAAGTTNTAIKGMFQKARVTNKVVLDTALESEDPIGEQTDTVIVDPAASPVEENGKKNAGESSRTTLLEEGKLNAETNNLEDPYTNISLPSSGLTLDELNFIDDKSLGRMLLWGVLGIGLFISGLVLLLMGLATLFDDSIVGVAIELLNLDSAGNAIRYVLLTAIILISLLDFWIFLVILVFEPNYLGFWKFRYENKLWGRQAILRHMFEFYVICIGLAAFIVCITTVVFALGFTVSILQVGLRILCKNVFDISVFGTRVENVCITIPGLTSEQLCGWDVLSVCEAVTNMRVRLLLFGSALWIWCHLIWVIVLVAALENHRKHKLVLEKGYSSRTTL